MYSILLSSPPDHFQGRQDHYRLRHGGFRGWRCGYCGGDDPDGRGQPGTDPDTLPPLRCRVAFRDVTRATDSRTVRAALIPSKVFITNAAPYLVWKRGDEKDQAYLLGLMCSLPLDWYARRFVEIHLNFHVLEPFPIPRPGRDNQRWVRVVELAGRLACPDKRLAEWAKAVGVDCGKLEKDEKLEMIHELDAVVAHLYGLSDAHSSAEITREVNLHSVPADARQAVQGVEDLIGPKWTKIPVWPEPLTNVTQ
jgi:hypothetical protein